MDIESMSIEEKIGQLFIVGFDDNKINGSLINLLTTYKVGGICFINNNFNNPQQVHNLSTTMQRYANKHFPLFIATYQQGGRNNTITNGVTISPSEQKLSQINNRLYTKQMAEIVAEELSEVGINLNLSPNLSLLEDDENSFGANIESTSRHGLAAISGSQNAGVIAAPQSNDYLQELGIDFFTSTTLQPYITKLQNELDTVVFTHDAFMNFHKTINASNLSDPLVLNETPAYDGLIISDCSIETDPDEIITSILYGADVILLNGTYKDQLNIINDIVEKVKVGLIDHKRINRSVERILALKTKRNIGKLNTFHSKKLKHKRSIAFAEKLAAYN